jgi:hypothetical protein
MYSLYAQTVHTMSGFSENFSSLSELQVKLGLQTTRQMRTKITPPDNVISAKFIQNLVYCFEEETRG